MNRFQLLALSGLLVLTLALPEQGWSVTPAFPGAPATGEGIPWVFDLAEARQLAQQQQRLVLLHFWGEGCPPCQALEMNVFNQPELARVMSTNFICVKINAHQQQQLAGHYKISRIPTDVIVLPNGQEIFRTTSPPKANAYIAMLDQVRANAMTQGLQQVSQVTKSADRAARGVLDQARGALDQMRQAVPALPPRESEEQPQSQPINQAPPAQIAAAENPAPVAQVVSAESPRGAVVSNQYFVAGDQAPAPAAPAAPQTPPAVPVTANGSRYGAPVVADTAPPAAPGVGNVANPVASQAGTTPPGTTPGWGANASRPPVGATPALNVSSSPATGPSAPPGYAGPSVANRSPGPAANPSQPARQAPPALPPNVPPLALDGYCPVTLVTQQKWEPGNPQFGAIHRGRLYLFKSQAEKDRFLIPGTADQFAPALSGLDPVRFAEQRQMVEGSREHGVFYQNQIYLFADEQSLAQFEQQPERYVTVVRQAMTTARQSSPQR